MTEQHPITPPPELVRKWNEETATAPMADQRYIAIQAARWGSDQELEACCELVRDSDGYDAAQGLRAERRPKPPSLKEQALKALNSASFQPGTDFRQIDPARSAIIRRALEALDD
jgi:hypothetical protein